MSGNSRIDVGEVAQSAVKGSALESAIQSLNNPTPRKAKKK